jgi:tRNA(Ile2) C34 agmatinyltransferase TiaS
MAVSPAFFRSLRRCPVCKKELFTNGRGRFFCSHCYFVIGVDKQVIDRHRYKDVVSTVEAGWYV